METVSVNNQPRAGCLRVPTDHEDHHVTLCYLRNIFRTVSETSEEIRLNRRINNNRRLMAVRRTCRSPNCVPILNPTQNGFLYYDAYNGLVRTSYGV